MVYVIHGDVEQLRGLPDKSCDVLIFIEGNPLEDSQLEAFLFEAVRVIAPGGECVYAPDLMSAFEGL